MKKPSESQLVRAILDYLALQRICAWRVNNVGIFDTAKRVFRSFHGTKGVADILGVLAPQGRILAIECKMPGKKPSAEQEAWLALVNESGGLAFVATSIKDVKEILRDEGYIL